MISGAGATGKSRSIDPENRANRNKDKIVMQTLSRRVTLSRKATAVTMLAKLGRHPLAEGTHSSGAEAWSR